MLCQFLLYSKEAPFSKVIKIPFWKMRREFKNKSTVFLIYLPVSGGHENKFSEEETLVYFSICGLQWQNDRWQKNIFSSSFPWCRSWGIKKSYFCSWKKRFRAVFLESALVSQSKIDVKYCAMWESGPIHSKHICWQLLKFK